MKKALLTIAVIVVAISAQAQDFRLGLSGGINSTWLMNKNVFDANDELDIASSFGGRFGVEGIYSFSEKIGVSLGVNFISGHNQKYTGEEGSANYDYKVKLRYLDIPVLFRLTSSGGTYFELGPQISILNSADLEIESSGFDVKGSIKDQLNTTNVALVLGFGVDIDVSEKIYITTGLRLGYGLSDVTEEYDNETELFLKTGDLGPTYWAHYEDAGTTGTAPDQFNYEKTSRVFGGLHIGVSYKFGGN